MQYTAKSYIFQLPFFHPEVPSKRYCKYADINAMYKSIVIIIFQIYKAQSGISGPEYTINDIPPLFLYSLDLNCLTHPCVTKDVLYDFGNITLYFLCPG